MSGISLGQKAERVLRLLMGLRNKRVAARLAAHGFTKKDLDEGWRLLRALTDNRLDQLPVVPPDSGILARLDAWENKWFPIAGVALEFRYPEAHAWLFKNLHQTHGLDVVVSVGTFLDRLGKLASQKQLANAVAARKILETRGLVDAAVAEAQELVDRLGSISKQPPVPDVTPEQEQAAEKALWDWYIEWSTIARTVIDNRNLLRQLGFLEPHRAAATGSADVVAAPTNGAPADGQSAQPGAGSDAAS